MEAYRVLECTVNSIEGIAACTTLQAPDANIFFFVFSFRIFVAFSSDGYYLFFSYSSVSQKSENIVINQFNCFYCQFRTS